MLRAFHDATRGSALAGESPIICHHDFGPNNAVFEGKEPVALIDFDMARPGEPKEDLGYTAWAWCVSSKPDRQPVSVQAHQVCILVEAYEGLGVWSARELVDAIMERQERNILFWSDAMRKPDEVATPTGKIAEVIAWSRRELAYTSAHQRQFEAALEGSLGRPYL